MTRLTTQIVSQAIDFIEGHLNEKLELETVANTLHYSKFHLHRMFTQTVGLTIHEYVQRRQLTEAAKLLIFSNRPILEIALTCGYESQQAFTGIFKALYKQTPAEFRSAEDFYPLQLPIQLKAEPIQTAHAAADIVPATWEDVEDWMELVRLAIDGFPHLDEAEHRKALYQAIQTHQAFVLREEGMLIGAMGISYAHGSIDFFAVHPQFRNCGMTRLFLDKLTEELLPGLEITTTTYRTGDKADTGYRDELLRLGFAEKELLVEYGYPTQRLALPPRSEEETPHETNTN